MNISCFGLHHAGMPLWCVDPPINARCLGYPSCRTMVFSWNSSYVGIRERWFSHCCNLLFKYAKCKTPPPYSQHTAVTPHDIGIGEAHLVLGRSTQRLPSLQCLRSPQEPQARSRPASLAGLHGTPPSRVGAVFPLPLP